MKTVFGTIIGICLMAGIGVSGMKFYSILEKELVVKLTAELPKLSTFTRKLN